MFGTSAEGKKMAGEQRSESDPTREEPPTNLQGVRDRFRRLTKREREVMQLVVAGKKTKEIAEQLDLSARTVEHHRASVMHKMEVRTVVELVSMAIRHSLYA
jgi:FixJ family two-component response regulator